MNRRTRLEEMLEPGISLREVEPGLYSVYAPGSRTNRYDEPGAMAFYDRVACNPLYNRLMWGYAVSAFDGLCRDALASRPDGWVLDAGCGSLAFTAAAYRAFSDRPVIFLDQSMNLLRKAKSRLSQKSGFSEAQFFLHGDVMRIPFRSGLFKTVIAMNLLHVITDLEGLLQEIVRVSSPACTMAFTTLVESSRWSDRYLRMWGRAGELIPRTPEQVLEVLKAHVGPVTCRISGNMASIRVCAEES